MITPLHHRSSLDVAAPPEEVTGPRGNRRRKKKGGEEGLEGLKQRGNGPILQLDSYPSRQKKRRLRRAPLQSAINPSASSRAIIPASV